MEGSPTLERRARGSCSPGSQLVATLGSRCASGFSVPGGVGRGASSVGRDVTHCVQRNRGGTFVAQAAAPHRAIDPARLAQTSTECGQRQLRTVLGVRGLQVEFELGLLG